MNKNLRKYFLSSILTLLLIQSFSAFASDLNSINEVLFAEKDLIASITLDKNSNYKKQMDQIKSLGFDVAGIDFKNKIVDLAINEFEISILEKNKFHYIVKWEERLTRGLSEEYKNPSEIEDILNQWVTDYPSMVTLIEIGKSFEGRTIFGVKITNPKSQATYKPNVLFNGMHHAREVMSPEAVLDIGEYLLTNQGDLQVSTWLNGMNVYLVPMVNVDGNNKVWNGSTMWRKNTNLTYGVDLNRNYPYQWGACNGSSGYASSQTYRGPSVASEVETQAMMKFVTKIRPVFDISFHSYSELIIYPLGCSGQKAKNGAMASVASLMSQEIMYQAGTPWELLYGVDGDDIDWMYTTLNVYPYVIELNNRKQGFQPDYKAWRDKTVKRIRPAWKILLNKTLSEKVYKGQLSYENIDSVSINVIKNNEVIETYKPHTDGRYNILLNSGTYTLKAVRGREILETKVIEIK